MKIIIISLLILNISVVHANENIYFAKMPPHVTTTSAIAAISKAAFKRKWTVYDFENNILRIELNHRDYKAVLKFSFSEKEIYYSDFTTYYNDGSDDFVGEGWLEKPAPDNWVRNLKNDIGVIFIENKYGINANGNISHENIVTKLESLKILRDKKLITESEHELKKKEIMSRY